MWLLGLGWLCVCVWKKETRVIKKAGRGTEVGSRSSVGRGRVVGVVCGDYRRL